MTHRIKPSDSTNVTVVQNKIHENKVFAMIDALLLFAFILYLLRNSI